MFFAQLPSSTLDTLRLALEVDWPLACMSQRLHLALYQRAAWGGISHTFEGVLDCRGRDHDRPKHSIKEHEGHEQKRRVHEVYVRQQHDRHTVRPKQPHRARTVL